MVNRTVTQKATMAFRQEENKLFSPEIYGTEFARGDIKKVSYAIERDLKDISRVHGSLVSSKVRNYIVEELDEQLEDIREAEPVAYEHMAPRIKSLKQDLLDETE